MKHHPNHISSESRAEVATASLTTAHTDWSVLCGPIRWAAKILLFLLAVHMLTGCTTAHSVSNDSTFSISQLESELQNEGVFVMPRGPANLDIPADQSSRLILNSTEVLNVFEFDSAEQARKHARAIAGAHPRHDVYYRETIVALRQTSRDTGLSSTLRHILGEAL